MCQGMMGCCRGVVEMLTLMMMRWWCRLDKQLRRREDGRWSNNGARSVERCIHVRASSAWRKSYCANVT